MHDQSLHLPMEQTQETNKTEDCDNVFAVEHIHDNLVLSLRCSRVSKFIIYICYNACRWIGRSKTKTVTSFPMWNTGIKFQSQVLAMHTLTGLLYILQRMSEKHPFTIYPATKHKKHSKLRITNIRGKSVYFFMGVLNRRLLYFPQ